MFVFGSSIARFLTVPALLPLVFFLSSCDLVGEEAPEIPLLDVEYRVIALGQSGATHAYGIFYVDDQGQEVTLTDVPLPWSYRGAFKAESRMAASIAQRGLREGYRAIQLQIYRDGVLSTEMEVSINGAATHIVGYDSDSEAGIWHGP